MGVVGHTRDWPPGTGGLMVLVDAPDDRTARRWAEAVWEEHMTGEHKRPEVYFLRGDMRPGGRKKFEVRLLPEGRARRRRRRTAPIHTHGHGGR